jgi:hypothetical protein
VLSKEKFAAGAKDSRNLGERLLRVLDCAEHQGGYHGVDAGVIEGKTLGGCFDDGNLQ